ncbi:hypothetical protein BHU61_13275 (plasmid) [Macrococcus epidermidis]|uniref:Uncharacterized protein n=1 Tax=Macrococcus epidermidis TaxID=1902580 RepID=A0A327ZLH6_9STAP|nr:hypothetical protein [Macrococcus epidermidis]RAK43563.1 hypothetical protein BHU61_13275 [Macrococcus epidermidis]
MTVLQAIIDEVTRKYEKSGRETDNIKVHGATNEEINEAIETLNLHDDFGFTLEKYSDSLPAIIQYKATTDKHSFILRKNLADDLEDLTKRLRDYEIPANIDLTSYTKAEEFYIEFINEQRITITFE